MNFSGLGLLSTLLFTQCLLTPFSMAADSPAPLPQTAPVPESSRRQQEPIPPTVQSQIPIPEPRPDKATIKLSEPATAPAPTGDEPEPAKPLTDPRSDITAADIMPEGEINCRKNLGALGVAFEDRKAERDAAAGCSLPYPLAVKSLSATIRLAPEAVLDCRMAEAFARFAKQVISPAAKAQLGSELTLVSQASAYVCRPRHNGQKMSEHAFGNALDISSLGLKDNTIVEIDPAPPDKQARFLDTIRKAACGPFKTVLGPGSDADHAHHLHLDLAPRRNGSTFCQ